MYDRMTERIQSAAYLQWEKSGLGSALDHWRCVEDIVCLFEMRNLLSEGVLVEVLKDEGVGYEDIVRGVAFRFSFYSGHRDADSNWYLTERLLQDSEWRQLITQTAEIFSQKKTEPDFCDHIRSERVREYYKSV